MAYVKISVERVKRYISFIDEYLPVLEDFCERTNRDLSHWRSRIKESIESLVISNIRSFYEDHNIFVNPVRTNNSKVFRPSSDLAVNWKIDSLEVGNDVVDANIALTNQFLFDLFVTAIELTGVNRRVFIPQHALECRNMMNALVEYSDGDFVTADYNTIKLIDTALDEKGLLGKEQMHSPFRSHSGYNTCVSIDWSISGERVEKTSGWFKKRKQLVAFSKKGTWTDSGCTTEQEYKCISLIKQKYKINELLKQVRTNVISDLNEIMGTEGFICTFIEDEFNRAMNKQDRHLNNA